MQILSIPERPVQTSIPSAGFVSPVTQPISICSARPTVCCPTAARTTLLSLTDLLLGQCSRIRERVTLRLRRPSGLSVLVNGPGLLSGKHEQLHPHPLRPTSCAPSSPAVHVLAKPYPSSAVCIWDISQVYPRPVLSKHARTEGSRRPALSG
jgi:hypothetical protein